MATYFAYVTENAKLFVSKFAKYLVLGVDFVQKPWYINIKTWRNVQNEHKIVQNEHIS